MERVILPSLVGSEPPRAILGDARPVDHRDAETWRPAGLEQILPPAVDLSELATDLVDFGYPLAAQLVRDGRREYAALIAADLRVAGDPDVLADQVIAWGARRDAAIVASNTAWRRRDCCRCAALALAWSNADVACEDCDDDAPKGGAR